MGAGALGLGGHLQPHAHDGTAEHARPQIGAALVAVDFYNGMLPALEWAAGDVELSGDDGAEACGDVVGGAAEGLDRLGFVGGEDGDAALGAQ